MIKLIAAARSNPVFANLLALFLIFVGFFALDSITVKLFPQIDLETITVSVPYPGATPEEVEDAVIKPIEQQIEGLEGIRKITAVASENIGSVVIALNDGEDQNLRLNDIQNEIDQITVFPQQAERPIIAIAEPDELAVQYIFTGDVQVEELKRSAEKMREMLVDLNGISDVRIEAAADYLIDVNISEDTLRAYDLSLNQVASIIESQSLDLSAGEIEGNNQRFLVRTLGDKKHGEEFAEIPIVAGDNGTIVRLGDIATITDGMSEDPTAGYYNGKPAVVLSVFRVGDEQIFNLVSLSKEVLKDKIQPRLPETIQAFLWRDESSNLQSRVDLLTENATLGLILVSVLLLLFIDIRVAFWVACGVAVSFIGSFVLLAFSGYTINQLSLFGFILAIGIVVDDAVVVGENIYSKREQGLDPEEAALKGTSEVALSVLVATMTTVAVFIPLLFIPGIYGQFMGPIAAVVIFVLIISLVESFYILPRHLSHLSDRKPRWFSPRRYVDPARRWTSHKLQWLVNNPIKKGVGFSSRRPIITCIGFAAIFCASMGLIFSGAVKFVFFPAIEGNYVTATMELSNQASDQQTTRSIRYLEKQARSIAEDFKVSEVNTSPTVIDGIFSTRGLSIGGGDPNAKAEVGAASNLAFVTIKIEDSSTRTFSAIDFERHWRQASGHIPGAKKLTFSSNLVTAGSPVQLEIKSRDVAQAKEVAAKMRQKLVGQAGVIDVQDDRFNTTEEVQLRLKPEALNYGVTTAILAQQIRASFFGEVAQRVQRDREEIDVRVRLTGVERSQIATIMNRRLEINGVSVPVKALANVTMGESPASIARKDGKRVITLSADVDTRVTTGGDVTSQLLTKVWPKLEKDYPEVEVTVGGDQEEQSRAGPAIARNFAISLFVVFALLALIFKSYTQPLVIMAIIPFGFMGALIGHFITGYDLTLLSMFGFIGLSGVVINDSLLLIQFINEKIAQGQDILEAVSEATLQRFRPIILTSLTTCFGVLPIIFERSVQAQFLAPTAVSLGIGILFATFILIFLTPALAVLQLKMHRKLFEG